MAIDLSGLNPISRLKNWVQETVYKKIGDYGKLSDIHLDIRQKSLELVLMMRGEDQAIKVELSDFTMIQLQKQDYLRIGEIQTSREWLTRLGQDYLDDRFGAADIPVSGKVALGLKIIL